MKTGVNAAVDSSEVAAEANVNANAEPPDSTTPAPTDGQRAGVHHESTTIAVVEPTIHRDEVGPTDERVGAIAYPYRVANARIRINRPLLTDREDEYVISVDRCRRLAIRADTVPTTDQRTVVDVLVLPSELTDEAADEKARDAAFRWTRQQFTLWNTPTVDLQQTIDAYKLFWLTETSEGTVLIDSVRGDRQPLST